MPLCQTRRPVSRFQPGSLGVQLNPADSRTLMGTASPLTLQPRSFQQVPVTFTATCIQWSCANSAVRAGERMCVTRQAETSLEPAGEKVPLGQAATTVAPAAQ